MKISNLLDKNLIFFNQKFSSKAAVLEFISKTLKQKGFARSGKKVLDLFWERENQISTGVGEGIALPHIRDDVMKQSKIFFAQVKPLDWDAADGQDINYIFGIAMTKEGGDSSHLEVIANLSKLLMNPDFVADLKTIKAPTKLIKLFDKYEQAIVKEVATAEEKITSSVAPTKSEAYDIVAVTACPTGIAHTFMAAEKLEQTAKAHNLRIKVETQGTEGAKNVLTPEDIKYAKGVILALDRAIDTERFAEHLNVIETSTRKAIHEPEKLFKQVKEDAGNKLKNVTKAAGDSQQVGELSFNNFGKNAYRSILTGVSYMLPFVIFGGIFIALAFLFDMIFVAQIGAIEAVGSNFGSIAKTSQWFMSLGGLAFGIMVPILSAYITYAMVGKMGLLPGFLVGFIATKNYNATWTQISDALGLNILGGDVNSGFFGAIGGAFLAAAILIVLHKYLFNKVSQQWKGIVSILVVPLFGTALILGIFWFVNIPLQYLNLGFTKFLGLLGSNPSLFILLALVIGLMMATDLGGPINKAAYVFGTVALTETLKDPEVAANGSVAMAAAIIAGMVPPLGIALSTTISKKYWKDEEIKAAKSNWILGFSFITEGAIPFTAARPKVMLISNLVGGGVAGLLVGALQVGALAPHGGIFIAPLFRTGLASSLELSIGLGIVFMLVALIVGMFVQALVLHFLLKREFVKKNQVKANQPVAEIQQNHTSVTK
ncbi:PTS fructose transporter subunit IIABC [Candidatus Mycoplasma pogonae]